MPIILTHFAQTALAKMKKQTIIWTIMILLLTASALAMSKPIAGRINGATGTVSLFVEVDFLDGKEICIINPTEETGPTGEFATNLANLVFQNFPQTKCSSFWKTGDKIWFEINSHQSEIQAIKPGTGLQFLNDFTVTIPTQDSGSGSNSGSTGPSTPTTPAPATETPQTQTEISTILTAEQNHELIEAFLTIQSNLNQNLKVKIILSDLFNENIIETKENTFTIDNQYENQYQFNLKSLEPGQYKLQAFVYDNQDLISVSNLVKFTLEPSAQETEQKPQPTQYPVYYYVILIIIIIALILTIWWVKKKK